MLVSGVGKGGNGVDGRKLFGSRHRRKKVKKLLPGGGLGGLRNGYAVGGQIAHILLIPGRRFPRQGGDAGDSLSTGGLQKAGGNGGALGHRHSTAGRKVPIAGPVHQPAFRTDRYIGGKPVGVLHVGEGTFRRLSEAQTKHQGQHSAKDLLFHCARPFLICLIKASVEISPPEIGSGTAFRSGTQIRFRPPRWARPNQSLRSPGFPQGRSRP